MLYIISIELIDIIMMLNLLSIFLIISNYLNSFILSYYHLILLYHQIYIFIIILIYINYDNTKYGK